MAHAPNAASDFGHGGKILGHGKFSISPKARFKIYLGCLNNEIGDDTDRHHKLS